MDRSGSSIFVDTQTSWKPPNLKYSKFCNTDHNRIEIGKEKEKIEEGEEQGMGSREERERVINMWSITSF